MNTYHKETEETLSIAVLKTTIKFNLERLGYKSEWSKLSADILDNFKEEYPKQDADDVIRLAEKIRKTLNDEKRKNPLFLEKLYKILEEKVKSDEIPNDFGNTSNSDDISELCRKCLNNFQNKDFSIPDSELNALLYSASIGHKLALRTLGDYYYYGGKFNIPNFIEAHRYYVLAVERECYISAYQLATMYENQNGFFDHKPIAYKYYELSFNFYLKNIAYDIVYKANKFVTFPNIFHKLAYYYGYLKDKVDDQGFIVLSYLGHIQKNEICSLYFAYALFVGKGINQDIKTARDIYDDLIEEHKETKSLLDLRIMSRLAVIYRDFLPNKEKYELTINKIKSKYQSYVPNFYSDIEYYANQIDPISLNREVLGSKNNTWNNNQLFNKGIYSDPYMNEEFKRVRSPEFEIWNAQKRADKKWG